MPARLHPGVYVEEVPSGARAIEAAGTSTAIFVGETERGATAPTSVKGIADYERSFGGYKRHTAVPLTSERVTLRYAIDAFFQNGGTSAYILRAIDSAAALGKRAGLVEASSPGKWSDNVSVTIGPSSDGDGSRFRIFVIYRAPGSSDRIVQERWDRLSISPSDENYAPDVLKRSLYLRWDSVVPVPPVAPPPFDTNLASPTDTDIRNASVALSGGTGGDVDLPIGNLPSRLLALDEITDASLLVIPARIGDDDDDPATEQVANAALSYAEGRPKQDLFAIADMPRLKSAGNATAASTAVVSSFKNNISPKTNFGAVYFPWVEINDPAGAGRDPTLFLGPSGFVAGLYARTDQRRGVWKAPAGLEATVLNARRLEYKFLDVHQDDLNPLGINALRVMAAGGNVVWGARTMQPSSEWRYIPVRRMAIFLRTSIYNGIQWAVFEPNDDPLWAALRLTIGGFMEQMHRQGAFAGKTTREAFFVKCDAETTPEADRIAGIVNVWVGFAPLRPAEFVVVKLSQIVNQKS